MLEVLAPLGWWSQANDVSLRGSCIEGLVIWVLMFQIVKQM